MCRVACTIDGVNCLPDGKEALGPGESFGELALMYALLCIPIDESRYLTCNIRRYFAPRAARCVALVETKLWVMDRVSFQTLLIASKSSSRAQNKSFLDSVPLLHSLKSEERNRVADALVEQLHKPVRMRLYGHCHDRVWIDG